MSSPFEIDVGPETPELLEFAKTTLRETPENREKGFKELRELLKQNPDLNYRDDDEFLTIVLRVTHWYPESALKMLRKVAEFRKEHEKLVKGLLANDEKEALLDGNIVNILKDKDHLGRRVMVMSQGKVWNPDLVTIDQIFRVLYIIHILAQLEKSSQINGVVVIMNYEGLSMKQIKAITPTATKRLLTFIQEAMMVRLREVHFVKQPFIFNMVWTLFKPFVKEKLKNRMYFHGDDMKKLHKHIPVEYLPKNYGGTLPEIDYSGRDWYPCVEKNQQYVSEWANFGFK